MTTTASMKDANSLVQKASLLNSMLTREEFVALAINRLDGRKEVQNIVQAYYDPDETVSVTKLAALLHEIRWQRRCTELLSVMYEYCDIEACFEYHSILVVMNGLDAKKRGWKEEVLGWLLCHTQGIATHLSVLKHLCDLTCGDTEPHSDAKPCLKRTIYKFIDWVAAPPVAPLVHKRLLYYLSSYAMLCPDQLVVRIFQRAHDVGKLTLSPSILPEATALNFVEQALMGMATDHGRSMLLVSLGECHGFHDVDYLRWRDCFDSDAKFEAALTSIGKQDKSISIKRIKLQVSDTAMDTEGTEQNTCVVCHGNAIKTVIVDCGHAFMCISCSRRLHDQPLHKRVCSICRNPIRHIRELYYSPLVQLGDGLPDDIVSAASVQDAVAEGELPPALGVIN